MEIEYVRLGNSLFKVEDVIAETKKTYIFHLEGLIGFRTMRKNGKDGKFFKSYPRGWK